MLAAIELLAEKGPTLDRPAGGHLRALFVFDPERRAIVLLGGDKRDDWSGWYVSRIDKEIDVRLSTLERYVEALGGKLELHAVFEDADIKLTA